MAEAIQQNQTLSLRISETLRKRLEDIRKLTALRMGESVSTSEIAKQLLESARGDRFETVVILRDLCPRANHIAIGDQSRSFPPLRTR